MTLKLDGKKFTVLWSGGKDSTASLLYVLNNVKSNNFKVLYIEITGNTDQRCNDYVHKVAESLGIEDKLIHHRATYNGLDFYQLTEIYGVPDGFFRWCLYKLKAPAIQNIAEKFTVTGLRKAESKNREKYVKEITYSHYTKTWSFNPIWDWNKEQVLDYIKDNGVKLNTCYEVLGHSGNCCFCPYADKTHIIKTLNDQYWRDKILHALEIRKDNLLKGEMGRKIYQRWTKYAKQRTILE